jgi:hypothetical protein
MVRGLTDALPLAGAAVAGIVLAAWTTLLMLGAAIGSHPLWRVEPLNLSEAAAMRDQAAVVQLIADGEDPYARREVRADLLFNQRAELTPIEAAIAGGRTEIVEIILFSSPRPSPAEWTRLRCLSDLEGAKNINDVLDRYRPESATLACDGVTRPWKE